MKTAIEHLSVDESVFAGEMLKSMQYFS